MFGAHHMELHTHKSGLVAANGCCLAFCRLKFFFLFVVAKFSNFQGIIVVFIDLSTFNLNLNQIAGIQL